MGRLGAGDDVGGRYHLGAPWIFMYEETLAALTLIASGVLDRYSELQVCISHCGGTVALAAPRFAASLGLHPQETIKDAADFEPSLHRLWVDSDIQSARSLQSAMDVLSPDHVVLGTDFPGWTAHPLNIYAPAIRDRLSKNGRDLLKLDRKLAAVSAGRLHEAAQPT